jgi:hypothetical protein
MPIPNVSTLYQRINKGSEGGHEFARFMKFIDPIGTGRNKCEEIIDNFIDMFNNMLQELSMDNPNVKYVDLRSLVGRG